MQMEFQTSEKKTIRSDCEVVGKLVAAQDYDDMIYDSSRRDEQVKSL